MGIDWDSDVSEDEKEEYRERQEAERAREEAEERFRRDVELSIEIYKEDNE